MMSPATEKKITEALAKHVFMVPVGKVARTTGLGQSSLINHQVSAAVTRGMDAGYRLIQPPR